MLNPSRIKLIVPHQLRKIPVRIVNHRSTRASVIDNCASWLCVCGYPVALQGRSGPLAGPTTDTVATCPDCRRLYFVIPHDRSYGPPIEVVELLGQPEVEPELELSGRQR